MLRLTVLAILALLATAVLSLSYSGQNIKGIGGKRIPGGFVAWDSGLKSWVSRYQAIHISGNAVFDGKDNLYDIISGTNQQWVGFFNGTQDYQRLGGRNGRVDTITKIAVTDDGTRLYACVPAGTRYGGPLNEQVLNSRSNDDGILTMDLTSVGNLASMEAMSWTQVGNLSVATNDNVDCNHFYMVGNLLVTRAKTSFPNPNNWWKYDGKTWTSVSKLNTVAETAAKVVAKKWLFVWGTGDYNVECGTGGTVAACSGLRLQKLEVSSGAWTTVWSYANDITVDVYYNIFDVNKVSTAVNTWDVTPDGNTLYFMSTNGTRGGTNEYIWKADISSPPVTSSSQITIVSNQYRFGSNQLSAGTPSNSRANGNILTTGNLNLFYDNYMKTLVVWGGVTHLVNGVAKNLWDRVWEYESIPVNGFLAWNAANSTFYPCYGGGVVGSPTAAPAFLATGKNQTLFGFAANTDYVTAYDEIAHQVIIYDDSNKKYRTVLPQFRWSIDESEATQSNVNAYDFKTVTDKKIEGYIAGSFRTIGNITVNSIAWIDSQGTITPLPAGKGEDVGVRKWGATTEELYRGRGTVSDIVRFTFDSNDYIYVTGEFNLAGNVPVSNVARYSAKDKQWYDVVGGIEGAGQYMVHDSRRNQLCIAQNNPVGVSQNNVFAGQVYFPGTSATLVCFDLNKQQWKTLNVGVRGNIVSMHFYNNMFTVGVSGDDASWGVTNSDVFVYDGKKWRTVDKGIAKELSGKGAIANYGVVPGNSWLYVLYGTNAYIYNSKSKRWMSSNAGWAPIQLIQPSNSSSAYMFDSNGFVWRYDSSLENAVDYSIIKGYPTRSGPKYTSTISGAVSVQVSLVLALVSAVFAMMMM